MSFSYYDKDNNIKRLNIEVGKEWSSYKEKDENSLLNSVFDAVDQNSDGKVDENELNILQKLLKIADSQIEKLKNNNIIEKKELEFIVNKLKTNELTTLRENKAENIITPNIIKIPDDIAKYTNYQYLATKYNQSGQYIYEVNVDYSALRNLTEGLYIIEYWDYLDTEDGADIRIPILRKINKRPESNQDGTTNWSEGINRNISKIQFDKTRYGTKLIAYMNEIGKEQGFLVELIDDDGGWLEDLSVVRADKKQLIPNSNLDFYENKVIAKRKNITINKQGKAAHTEILPPHLNYPTNAEKYSRIVFQRDIILGKTYLEGGNVLNTLDKNGEPSAIIGEESIKYTILAMEDDKFNELNNEGAIIRAKKQIAKELGLKEKNVTYIPQFDFHIDMHYRPLNNGQIAVPDYEAGINILKGFIQDIDKQLATSPEQKKNLLNKKEEYSKLILKLEVMKTKTAEISKEAEEELKNHGYEIVRIPSFTDIDEGDPVVTSVENAINYMNGVCGTSAKTGDKFYITNTSGDETLDAYMENYFKEVVGFDKVYFAPTKKYLEALGGIDCLTKEF